MANPSQGWVLKRKRESFISPYSFVVKNDFDSILDNSIQPSLKRLRITVTSKSLAKKKIFPFLDLPGEIRNMIYKECFFDYNKHDDQVFQSLWLKERDVWHQVSRMKPGYWNLIGARQLALHLLLVCKQIYQEAVFFLYSQRFVFTTLDALYFFALNLHPRYVHFLRYIQVRSPVSRFLAHRAAIGISVLADRGVVNLRKLDLVCDGAFSDYAWKYHTRGFLVANNAAEEYGADLFRDWYPWLKAAEVETNSLKDDVPRGLDVLKISRCGNLTTPSGTQLEIWTERETKEKFQNWSMLVRNRIIRGMQSGVPL